MKKRVLSAISMILLAVLALTACGSSYSGASAESTAAYSEAKEYDGSYAYGGAEAAAEEEGYEEAMEEPAEPAAEPGGGSYTAQQDNGGTTLSNDKLVYTCNLEIETTEYQKTVESIRAKIRQYNAIIEYESETDSDYKWYYSGHVKNSGTMRLSMTIRVPVAQYDAFVTDAGDFGKATSKSQNVENISRKYHSTEARIEALTKEEQRLTEMLDKAETIEEMIYIEERLTEVEAELNANKTNLASMDVDVAYSTVNLNVAEVLIYTEPEKPTITFGQRVARAFKESWEGFTGFMEGLLIVAIHLLPFMICALILVGVIVGISRAADKRNPERRARRERKKAEKREAKARKQAMKRGAYPPRRPFGGPGAVPPAPAAAPKTEGPAEPSKQPAAPPADSAAEAVRPDEAPEAEVKS